MLEHVQANRVGIPLETKRICQAVVAESQETIISNINNGFELLQDNFNTSLKDIQHTYNKHQQTINKLQEELAIIKAENTYIKQQQASDREQLESQISHLRFILNQTMDHLPISN